MLQLTEDGYKFISENGIEYDILEGVTIGVSPRKTSDMIFIYSYVTMGKLVIKLTH